MTGAKRILVADDSETITTLLATTLRTSGYEVEVAHDGVETYELGKESDFDLVILDQLMPGMLGLDIIEKWREDGVELDVIVLTAVDDERTAVDSFAKGALDFVRKPFRLPELMARIKQRLAD